MKMIKYASDEAAEYKTIELTGWWSNNGRFYNEREDLARYDGCTHVQCKLCDTFIPKHRIICDKCKSLNDKEKYINLKNEKEWDQSSPIYSDLIDEYFYDIDQLEEYCLDTNIKKEDLLLYHCSNDYFSQIGDDYFYDDLPEDQELPPGLQKKIDELNAYIKTLPPSSYSPDFSCKIKF